jgi:hypothetical protein
VGVEVEAKQEVGGVFAAVVGQKDSRRTCSQSAAPLGVTIVVPLRFSAIVDSSLIVVDDDWAVTFASWGGCYAFVTFVGASDDGSVAIDLVVAGFVVVAVSCGASFAVEFVGPENCVAIVASVGSALAVAAGCALAVAAVFAVVIEVVEQQGAPASVMHVVDSRTTTHPCQVDDPEAEELDQQ